MNADEALRMAEAQQVRMQAENDQRWQRTSDNVFLHGAVLMPLIERASAAGPGRIAQIIREASDMELIMLGDMALLALAECALRRHNQALDVLREAIR